MSGREDYVASRRALYLHRQNIVLRVGDHLVWVVCPLDVNVVECDCQQKFALLRATREATVVPFQTWIIA